MYLASGGVEDPEKAIKELLTAIDADNEEIIGLIAQGIYDNYQSSQDKKLNEIFNIDGIDNDNLSISKKINDLYLACQTDDQGTGEKANTLFLKYVSRKEVQKEYLNRLLKDKYTHFKIAEAYLTLTGKKLALFIEYDNKISYQSSDADPTDVNCKCILYRPGKSTLLAHYDRLIFKTLKSSIKEENLNIQYENNQSLSTEDQKIENFVIEEKEKLVKELNENKIIKTPYKKFDLLLYDTEDNIPEEITLEKLIYDNNDLLSNQILVKNNFINNQKPENNEKENLDKTHEGVNNSNNVENKN